MQKPNQLHSSLESQAASEEVADASVADDVMKVLADVEGQLTRLRAVQKTQDDAILSLSERAKALSKAEDEIESQRKEITRERKTLQRDQDAVQSQERDFETRSRK